MADKDTFLRFWLRTDVLRRSSTTSAKSLDQLSLSRENHVLNRNPNHLHEDFYTISHALITAQEQHADSRGNQAYLLLTKFFQLVGIFTSINVDSYFNTSDPLSINISGDIASFLCAFFILQVGSCFASDCCQTHYIFYFIKLFNFEKVDIIYLFSRSVT